METIRENVVSAEVKNYKVDTNESIVNWHGKKVLGQHNGTVKITEGNILVKDNKVTGGKVKVDISTLESLDLVGDEKTKAMLEGHLKSDDFFNAEKFPDITFVINSVEESSEKNSDHVVTGDLTIRDVTKTLSFPGKISVNELKLTAEIEADIDRTDFGLKYGSGKFFAGLGDNLISDKFSIRIHIIAAV